MTDAVDFSTFRYRHDLVAEVDGPADDAVLEVTITETVVLDENGAGRGMPELVLRTGVEGVTLTDRDQVLRLQAMINRAVNQWRDAATHLP
ncbi:MULTISPECIES: hypothetical protein [unclassified Dietzia]|uniref:hypothetical protein n=1 Tax=unclassified Dietzia TaxID=2617939 RepID=UPI0015FC4396|nr:MULTISPECIES: hypothetical protein [unclassified Dietzia]MBB1023401.1 hypothetical protein [Dietzia sp. DQ12-76]MBB1027546.1 hypothetical protein [Dietzia sp. DQ11-38-2]